MRTTSAKTRPTFTSSSLSLLAASVRTASAILGRLRSLQARARVIPTIASSHSRVSAVSAVQDVFRYQQTFQGIAPPRHNAQMMFS